jgi:hypothetical protein
MILWCPFHEFELTHRDRLHSSAFLHFCCRQPLPPSSRHFPRKICKWTLAPKKERANKLTIPPAPRTGREGSKATKILELLRRDGGATLADLMQATEWQAHSVRGFLSGTLRKKIRLNVQSAKNEAGERSYLIAS